MKFGWNDFASDYCKGKESETFLSRHSEEQVNFWYKCFLEDDLFYRGARWKMLYKNGFQEVFGAKYNEKRNVWISDPWVSALKYRIQLQEIWCVFNRWS
jgi:hypothetical protein